MSDCIFCKIVDGTIPGRKLLETDEVLAFYDIEPQAPFHAVLIPKQHTLSSMDDIDGGNSAVMAPLFEAVARIAAEQNLQSGYRVVINCGEAGGQTVHHLHLHILAGRILGHMADKEKETVK